MPYRIRGVEEDVDNKVDKRRDRLWRTVSILQTAARKYKLSKALAADLRLASRIKSGIIS
jgi:hypothetical protein